MNYPRSVLGLALAVVMGVTPLAQPLAQEAPVATAPATTPAPLTPLSSVGEGVAAIVNDEIISTYDVRQRMLLLILEARVRPTEAQLPAIQNAALSTLIDERLQLQELTKQAAERKVDLMPADEQVTAQLADIAGRSNMTVEGLEGVLRQAGVSPQTLRDRLKVSLGWERWIRGRFGSRLRIGQDQVQTTLQRISQQSSRPQFLLSEIFLDASRVGGMDEAMAGAQQLVAQIQQGAPFGAVARQFSAAPSAAADGDAGWLVIEEVPAPLRPVVEQMRPGQLSQPVAVSGGVYIVQLRQRTSGAGATLVNLKQAAMRLAPDAPEAEVAAARATLTTLRGQLNGCETLEERAAAVTGVIAGDLGEVEASELLPEFRTAAQTLQPGQVSEPIRTSVGLHLVAVCGRRTGGAQALTPDQVENRLFAEQLELVSRRYMRDLRNSATIDVR